MTKLKQLTTKMKSCRIIDDRVLLRLNDEKEIVDEVMG